MNTRIRLIAVCVLCGLAGLGIGLTMRADGLLRIVADALGQPESDSGESGDSESGPDGEVHLTETAQKTLALRTGIARPGNFIRHIRLPGEVLEKPGHSGRTVASRVRGIVRQVFCSHGQLVRPGDPLFRIQLSGDAIVTAQVALLETRQQIESTRAELDRITKLVTQGTVPARERIQLEYSLKRVESLRDLRRKELLVRGLTATQIDQIAESGELLDEFLIRVRGDAAAAVNGQPELASAGAPAIALLLDEAEASGADVAFTVEEINVHPGQSIGPGDQLADLAWHDRLFVVGHAFERDVLAVTALNDRGWAATIEYGAHDATVELPGLPIQFMDNHVDEKSGTFRFYVDIENTLLQDRTHANGAVFRTWRFKPGQRVHVRIPVEELTGQFVLPREAVVQEGPDAFVFRYGGRAHAHDHSVEEADDHAHDHEAEDMFLAVPVSVLHRDSRSVVVANGGKLLPGTKIAMNNAYQLYIASRAGSGGGSGHGHPHPH